jgi:hypothetical protein
VFALSIVPLFGQNGFYLGLQAGLSNENPSVDKIKFDRDSAFLYGGQFGFRLSSLAIEGRFFRSDHDLLSPDPRLDDYDGLGLDYYYIGVNAKLGIPLAIVYPYLTVGYGLYAAKIEDVGDESTSSFCLGGGAELTLGKVGVFAELLYIDFSVDLTGKSWDFGGMNVHAGLNFHF